MLRWMFQLHRHLRWSSPVTQGLFLCLLTFGLILPLYCHRGLYSYFFLKSWYLDLMSDEALQRSFDQGQRAFHYWQDLANFNSPVLPLENEPVSPELLVTVVTAKRTDGQNFHYLLQVMHKLDQLLGLCGKAPCAEVLVCDVANSPKENEDVGLVKRRFRVVRRTPEEQKKASRPPNVFEKEKRDYVYCLRKGQELLKPRNVVVLEDDALPLDDFFEVIQNLLSRRFVLSTLYVKLYHPERLQRYWNPEPCRILEWIGLGVVGATLMLLFVSVVRPQAQPFSVPLLLFLVLYVMAVAELTGRHYLLELRRFSPQLYAVSPATECCTPAMLYPGNASSRVAVLLDGAFCQKGNGKDMVLYRLARAIPGERAHSVEPNLVHHIGAFSSVRNNPFNPRLL